jgi:RNA polymerase primary sigma factor
MAEIINNINIKEQELFNELGRSPTIQEISIALGGKEKGYEVNKISNLKKITSKPVSLEKPVKTDDESHFADFISDNSTVSVERSIENEMKYEELYKLMQLLLTPEEDQILCMRMGLKSYTNSLSLEDIAKSLKASKEKIRQIENRALRKLKQHANNSVLLRETNSDD